MNILIRGGRVIDPANRTDAVQDLYIADGHISPPFAAEDAHRIIDALGRIVCPGFIDIHMHEDHLLDDGSIYADGEKSIFHCMLRMGVTSAVGGNCGESVCHPADYLDRVDAQGTAVNVAMLAGHEYFRMASGCTDRYGPATPEQIRKMDVDMENALDRGCLGVSYGIRYVPGMDMAEFSETAAGCRRQGKVIAAHIRSDADEVFDAAREFLDAAGPMGVPVQLSHIGSMAGFGQMDEFLKLVDEYRQTNGNIRCDCYPYDAYSTGIGSTTYDDGWQNRYGCGYDVVEIAEGQYKGQRCTKEIFDEVRRDFPDYMTICHVMNQPEIDKAYLHESVMLGSDGTLSSGQGHPRAAGAFPRFLAKYVGSGALTVTQAIEKMTALPARQLGLDNKGHLAVGADGDVVIFDPAAIRDNATFAQPLLAPTGIETVIVNGIPALHQGEILSHTAGRSIRKIKEV